MRGSYANAGDKSGPRNPGGVVTHQELTPAGSLFRLA